MLTRLALAVSLLAACSGSDEPDIDRLELEAVERAWLDTPGLPDPEGCLERTYVVRHPAEADFKAQCRTSPTGCTTRAFSRVPFRDVVFEVHISPSNPHVASTLRHEACHVLIWCTYLRPHGDYMHTDPRIWTVAGGETSVQSRAGQ